MPLSTAQQEAAQSALAQWGRDPRALVQILRETQSRSHWLPRPLLEHLAQELRLPLAQVEGVAGFYRFFHLQPRGRIQLLFSDNITDRMAGNTALMARLCQALGLPAQGGTDPQGRYSVGLCSCTGLCDQGPAVLVNHHRVFTRLDAQRIDAMAALMRDGVEPAHWPAAWAQVDDQVRRAQVLLAPSPDSAQVLQALCARSPQAMWQEIEASQLRGRGGAGFSTATKWRLCRDTAAPLRTVVCNADEGEPGTFKDRVLLTRHAHTLLDGMSTAAWVVGAAQGFIYLRGEYRYLLEPLQAVLAQRRAQGLLGRSILGREGFDFDVQIHLGAGAYVCGEESALLESLEGRRGVPRIRPPFPVQSGYQGTPTVVNNVETFCAAAHIALNGGAWWAAMGTAHSSGTKIHSVSGDCERPGLYEYAMGTPIDTVLQDCGARSVQAVQVGGPSGLCVPATEFGRRLAFEDVPSAGAFMVFDASRDLFEVARHFAHFFAHESCGHCTPCRVGTDLVVRRLDKLAQTQHAGRGSEYDWKLLQELDAVLHTGTHCGLGQSACNPLRDTMKHFARAYQAHLLADEFEPEFDLDAELSSARRATQRTDTGAHLDTTP